MTKPAALCVLAALAAGVAPGVAQSDEASGLPATDIYLAALSWTAEGQPVVGQFENATRNPGYDNQPWFAADGRSILYTREALTGGTDIWRLDLDSGALTPVLVTPASSEFSPQTPFEDQRVTVVRQDGAGAQRIFVFDPDSPSYGPLYDIAGLGYYAHSPANDMLVAFVLGAPPTLEIQPLPDGPRRRLVSDAGRSLSPSPEGGVLFVSRGENGGFWMSRVAGPDAEPEAAFALPGRSQDIALSATPAGGTLFWSVSDDILHVRSDAAEDGWRPLVDLGAAGLRDATRVAVSVELGLVAVVARD